MRGRGLTAHILAAIWLLAAACPALAMPVVNAPDKGGLDLAPLVEYFLDPDAGLTYSQVLKPPHVKWKPAGPGELNFKFTRAAAWLRFTLANPSARHRLLYLSVGYPYLDHIDLFVALPGQGPLHMRAGDTLPAGEREVNHRGFVFPISLPPGARAVCHMRVVTSTQLSLPLLLLTPESLAANEADISFWLGLYFGALVIMAVYNLFLYLRLKQNSHLYYLAYAAGLGLAMLSFTGLAAQHLWPGHPWWGDRSLPFLLCLAMVWGLMFCRAFLETGRILPAVDKGFLCLVWLNVLGMFLALLVEMRWAVVFQNNLLLLSATFSFTAGVMIMRRGNRTARFFLLAWGMMALGILAHALRVAGVLPGIFLTHNGLMVGSGLELLFLSFALAERMGLLGREREAALAGKMHYEDLSRRDALTGLFNRRHFLSRLKAETQNAQAQCRPLSLIILDLDQFKKFNDTHGHPEGDRALKTLAEVLAASLREGDAAGRYGGEEFVAMLPGAGRDQAWVVAERIRKSLADRALCVDGTAVHVTASLGLAELEPQEDSAELVRRADRALYRAKSAGKNRTETA